MAVTMPWGESIEVTMELGFAINKFTLNDATLGELDGIGRLDGVLEGIDVTPYVTSLGTSRGRPDQLQQFVAGTATILLKNFDRRFDPTNTASPYWDPVTNRSGVAPRRKIAISSDGELIFVGRITDIDIDYEPIPTTNTLENSFVSISAADDFALLANAFTESDLTPAEELSGDRISYILDLPEVNYPATRDISDGVASLGGGSTFQIDANTNALSYLLEVNTAEQGYLFIARDGDLTFRNRISATFATIAAFFSDDGTAIPYRHLSIVYGSEFLYNKVICSIIGGTEQIADNIDSQNAYGISTLSLNNLLLSSDAEAGELATDLLDLYGEPAFRFDQLTSLYNALDSTDRATVTTLDIGQVVQITRNFVNGSPTEIVRAFAIEGIKHSINPNEHRVELLLSPTEILVALILDDPEFGTLDSTNALAPSQLQDFFMDLAAVDSDYTFT